jgi:hypothetical protein
MRTEAIPGFNYLLTGYASQVANPFCLILETRTGDLKPTSTVNLCYDDPKTTEGTSTQASSYPRRTFLEWVIPGTCW